MKKLILGLTIGLSFAGLFTYASTIPVSPARFTANLSTDLTTTGTSMTLSSGTDFAGVTLSGYICYTVDEANASYEYMCGTTEGTSVTGLTRGIDAVTGTTTVTALKKKHRIGATVKITDHPSLTILARIMNGIDTLPNIISYVTQPTFISGTQLVDKTYVDGGILAGAATSTESTIGIVRLATALQTASSTATTANTPYVIQAQNATSTYNSATAPLKVVVTQNDGKIDSNFIRQSDNFAWTGGNSFTGANTFSGKTTFATTTTTTQIGKNFGGDGSDGALVITSGTTTVDCLYDNVCTKNYTSISITGTGALAFSNPAINGTTIILRSQGDVTLTSSSTPNIDAMGMGASGGIGSLNTTGTETVGGNGTTALGIFDDTTHGGLGVTGGLIYTNLYNYSRSSTTIARKSINIAPGSGGGGGSGGQYSTGSNGTYGGNGGKGGGSLILEVGGYFNFTKALGISVKGQDGISGTSGTGGNGYAATGAGGGGSGGFVVVLYNNLIANSGTVNTAGGAGGAGGNSTDTTGGAGGVSLTGGAGGGGAGCYGGAGGNGGATTGADNAGNNGSNGAGSRAGGGGGSGATAAYNTSTTRNGGTGGTAGASENILILKNLWF
jgi:hypothetical protein